MKGAYIPVRLKLTKSEFKQVQRVAVIRKETLGRAVAYHIRRVVMVDSPAPDIQGLDKLRKALVRVSYED